ncbi:MAG: cdd [Firmicutes bacterium]|nr:cdd [Bacillota bacterium]
MDDELIAAAQIARFKAYAPYSHFSVGAAVRAASGRIYCGCNIENASYGLTNCAERTAIFKAVSEGEMVFNALAVVADTEEPVTPCGACRQVMAEFGINTVVMGNTTGKWQSTTLDELLPLGFKKPNLPGKDRDNE